MEPWKDGDQPHTHNVSERATVCDSADAVCRKREQYWGRAMVAEASECGVTEGRPFCTLLTRQTEDITPLSSPGELHSTG